jgi:hypothetical protein
MPLLLCGRLDSILLSIEAWDASLFATWPALFGILWDPLWIGGGCEVASWCTMSFKVFGHRK